MAAKNTELTLELRPKTRFDLIDVTRQIEQDFGDSLSVYPKTFYYSYHTTAGYLEQDLCSQLNHCPELLGAFVQSFQKLFPPDADYQHDQLLLRTELTPEQRFQEPCNADSHLTFIGAGLTNSVTYRNNPQTPVYFIDLDGVNGNTCRRRQTTVVGFTKEHVVAKERFIIPVSEHPIDSVNLKDARYGLLDQMSDLLDRYEIRQGCIDLSLADNERSAGLTVNEYETLLMKHDLAQVLRNPLRFMAAKSKEMLCDPSSIPTKFKDHAKYDLVKIVNEFVDTLGLNDSIMERLIDKFLSVPASHFLRMKRSVSLPVSNNGRGKDCSILEGNYQSPVLVQWEKAEDRTRHLDAKLIKFE